MTEKKEWSPSLMKEGSLEDESANELEHLLSDLEAAKKSNKPLACARVKIEINEFYEKNPVYDPRNERWSEEFQRIGSESDLRRQDDWLRKSTWTILEAVNLIRACRPERPISMLDGVQRQVLNALEEDVHVLIHPVNPNEASDKYRFKPREFVAWFASLKRGQIPGPLESLYDDSEQVDASCAKEGELNNHQIWRETRRKEHRKAIRFVIDRWPDDCLSPRGNMTGESVAQALEDHWVEVSKNIEFTRAKLGIRAIEDLAREVLSGDSD